MWLYVWCLIYCLTILLQDFPCPNPILILVSHFLTLPCSLLGASKLSTNSLLASWELYLRLLLCHSNLNQLSLFYHQTFITFILYFFFFPPVAETWHFLNINSHVAQVLIMKRPYFLSWLIIMQKKAMRTCFLLARSLLI